MPVLTTGQQPGLAGSDIFVTSVCSSTLVSRFLAVSPTY